MIITLNSTAQTWSWASAAGGRSGIDGATGIDRDAAGNTYVCGSFEGTRNFGGTAYTAVGLSDYFFSKFNSAGIHQWTVQLNGSGTNVLEAGGIAVDANGNIFISGNFSFNVILGGNTYFNPSGSYDGFIAKYSPSGIFISSSHLSGPGSERISAIETFGTDVYISGSYSQAFSFGTISLSAPAASYDDAFLIKMDNAGVGVWGVKGGGGNDDRALALSVSSNTIYWAGYFSSTANFGGTNLTAIGSGSDMFLVKLNSSGIQQWAMRYGGNFGQQFNGVSQDPWGNAICTGNFYGTASFGTGFTITEAFGMAPAGNGDAFIAKFNESNGSCSWLRQIKCINGDNNEVSTAISTDPGGSSYITGAFNLNTSFSTNTSQTGTVLTTTGGKDAFIAKYSPTGTLLWVQKIGGVSNDQGMAVMWDANGYCNIAGNFGGTITLGTTPAITASPGAVSMFIARYDGLTTGINTIENNLDFEVFPNPVIDVLNIHTAVESPIQQVEIFNINGVKVYEENNSSRTNELQIRVTDLTPGNYFLHVYSGSFQGIKKIQVF